DEPPRSAARAADGASEELSRPHLRPTLLALDLERRRERRRAGGAAVPQLTATVRARPRKPVLELEEVALRVPALHAEGHVVAERPPPFFLDPVALRPRVPSHARRVVGSERPRGEQERDRAKAG